MRDPKRIDKVLNTIRLVWSECSDLRLTQLIVNALGMTDQVIFYIEDEVLIKKIAEFGLEFVKDETEDKLLDKLLAESGMLDDLMEDLRGAIKDDRTYTILNWEEELDNV